MPSSVDATIGIGCGLELEKTDENCDVPEDSYCLRSVVRQME
jgi:hypothetical protein